MNRNGFALSGERYYKRYRDICAEMVVKYGVNFFKYDGMGPGNNKVGGEEFLVVCPSTDSADGSLRVAERIRDAVGENEVKMREFEGRVSISLGVAVSSPHVSSIDELLKLADTAVYEAKHGGRNRSVVARPPPSDRESA